MKFPSRLIFIMTIILGIIIGCGNKLSPYHYVSNYHHVSVPIRVVPIYIDKDFDSNDLESISKAIKQWNYVLNGYIELEVMTTQFNMSPLVIKEAQAGNGWIILKINHDSKLVHDNVPGRVTLAYCDEVGGYLMYIIRDRLEADDIYYITMHELGHLLGADHTVDGLMYFTYDKEKYRCIDYRAVVEVARHNFLVADRMNYCVAN